MEEIKKNGYNLNISRYVSTSQEEEQIDLRAVHAKLAQLDKKIEAAQKAHKEFLKELGLAGIR